ncbi:MAG TPA: serine/threonine-protein kinase [Myxococcaceae bacterium]|jgi:serine/threonine-protein kinase
MTSADPMIGARLGDYVVEERIGAGGMGIVYRARQVLIGKPVAIKILSPHLASHPEAVQRLLAEARMVSTIQHHGIIDIFGFGELPDGRQYMVMECLKGTPLDAYLARHGRLEPSEAFTILDEVLSALGAAHAAGVIHRDLKPNNIFLVQQPDGTRYIKLLDFGIAKAVEPSEDSPHTAAGLLLGTPEYMAPEQVRSGPISPRTDLYSLGVVAFRLLTGELPFSGDRVQVLLAQAHEPHPVPSQLTPGLPPGIDRLISWLMAKNPEERPASADEVRRAMAELRKSWGESPRYTSTPPKPSETTVPLMPTPMPPPPKPRRRWPWAAGASVGLLAAVGLAWWLLHRPPPPQPPPPEPVVVVNPPEPSQEPIATLPDEPAPQPEPELPPEPEPQPEPELKPQPEPEPGPRVGRTRAKPRPRPGAAQLAQYTRLKNAYEARIQAGNERDPKAERQLESAREFAERASKTQDRQEAKQLLQAAQELLDDWTRDYQQ